MPDEILWLILGDFTEPPWHAAVAQVSRRWRGIVLAWAERFPRGSPMCPLTLRQSTMHAAINADARSVAVWLRDQCGCPMGPWAFGAARYRDYGWWVRWLRAPSPPCPWDPEALRHAVGLWGHGDLLQWMRAQPDPCPWHPKVCAAAAEIDSMRFSMPDRGHAKRRAARGRRVRVAKRPPLAHNTPLADDAVGNHRTPVLAWLRAQDPPCPWDEGTCSAAAWYADVGGSEVLRWLRAQDPPCPWDARTLTALAFRGTVEAFVWAYDQGAPCNGEVVHAAVSKGRLDLLTVILDRCGDAKTPKGRAVWTPRVFIHAAYAKDPVAVGTWLSDAALCRVDDGLCTRLAEKNAVEALAWARARGFPLNAPYACYGAAHHGSTEALVWLRDVERIGVDTVRKAVDYIGYAVHRDAKRISKTLALLDRTWPDAGLQAARDADTA
ncbi:F-box incomplete domain containing protein [Pandoravirus japonicus]|uniref:F-box incomplete domain containing protein n=1 Tax=Pandoravirus japonicus TaxID=2823154 RepID=A0A811BNF8_9VIRU|nr:F-box incomplete domain containing protein [Pandoravirus japonicus]